MSRLKGVFLVLSLVLLWSSLQACAQRHVWAWGQNWFGQLGDGTNTNRSTPVQVVGLTGVAAIEAGHAHSLALRYDGTVWAWGRNREGQLGDGSNTDRLAPVQSLVSVNVVGVSAGGYHSLALASDRRVWAWGWNREGQLGDGTTTTRWTPAPVSGLDDVVAVAAGGNHSLALRRDGTVWAWGANHYGQIGIDTGPAEYCELPVHVTGLPEVVAIAAGLYHSVALGSDGTVWAWGYNGHGQLGDGTGVGRPTPMPVVGLRDVIAVATGLIHCLALRSDGTVWAWGENFYGQLGDGTNTRRYTPVQVVDLTDVASIAAGSNHSLAVRSDGTLWAWGGNEAGQLGDGTDTERWLPAQVTELIDVWAVGGGGLFTVAGGSPRTPTDTCVLDRTGTITETVTLRAYLRRVPDFAPLPSKTMEFRVDGTDIGSALTDNNGQADLDWIITAGPATRTIEASFAGDGVYTPSNGFATLTALSWVTKMVTFDRMARIGAQTELKCRLVRNDNEPISNKSINFYVDGTFISSVPTDAQGYARLAYVVPDGPGEGARTILSEWVGDAGYAGVRGTATLTVLKARPHIWVRPTSADVGGVARLYAYFRRLPDLQPQQGKTVSFSVDGTWIGDAITGGAEPGIARYDYLTSGLIAGTYTLRCTYAGDPWVDSGYGESPLTIMKATPHIWVLPRVVAEGKMARLYALFRRLPDLQPQEGKTVSFSIDGTWIADVVTGGAEPGVARYNFRTWGFLARTYTIRCDFAGDASLEPGFGQATLTIVP